MSTGAAIEKFRENKMLANFLRGARVAVIGMVFDAGVSIGRSSLLDVKTILIAAASIVAKVYRDRMMRAYHEQFPAYGFSENKGYGTARHLLALKEYGPCPIHRLTFRGVS